MSVNEIITLVLALAVVAGGISWAALFSTGRSVIKNARELRDRYQNAVADGTITDTEKAQIATEAIELIEDLLDLWQQSISIFHQIKRVILRK